MDSRLDELRRFRASGQHQAVIRLALQLLEAPEGLTDPELFEAARSGAVSAQAVQQIHLALRFAEQEMQWAETTGDSESQTIALYHHGSISLRCGDVPVGLEELRAFLDAAEGPALARYRPMALFNLGLAYTQRRDYAGAVMQFQRARVEAQEQHDAATEIRALLEIAWVELLDGRTESAGYRLQQATDRLTDHPDDSLQATYLVHQAFYHFNLSEYAPAVRCCEEVLTPGRPGVEPLQLSEAAWIAGECALVLGQLETARYMALLARDEAERCRWASAMNRAADLLRRVTTAQDRKQGLA